MEYGGFSSLEELRDWVDGYCDELQALEFRRLQFFYDIAQSGLQRKIKGGTIGDETLSD